MILPIHPDRTALGQQTKAVLSDWFQALFPELNTPTLGNTLGLTGSFEIKCSLVRMGRFCQVIINIDGLSTSSGGNIPVPVNPYTPQSLDVAKGSPLPVFIGKAGISDNKIYLPDWVNASSVQISGLVVEK